MVSVWLEVFYWVGFPQTTPIVGLRPSDTSLKDGELGLPIYLLVGFLTLLLDVASNAALAAKLSPLLSHKANPHPLWFLLSLSSLLSLIFTLFYVCQLLSHSSYLPLYSLPLVGIQIITFCINSHAIPLLPRIPKKLIPFEDSLETCTWRQIVIDSRFPQGTNYARGTDLSPDCSFFDYPWPPSWYWA